MPKDLPTIDDLPAGQVADKFMKNALAYLTKEHKSNASSANNNAITFLETAMMWNNKDRTLKGQVTPYATHADPENLTELPK